MLASEGGQRGGGLRGLMGLRTRRCQRGVVGESRMRVLVGAWSSFVSQMAGCLAECLLAKWATNSRAYIASLRLLLHECHSK